MTTYCFDLDGTICTNTEGQYDLAKPLIEIINEIKRLKNLGNNIIIFTARGSGTGQDWRSTTEYQLKSWDVPFDKLIFNKPAADVYIDDKAVNISEFRLITNGLLTPEHKPAIFVQQ